MKIDVDSSERPLLCQMPCYEHLLQTTDCNRVFIVILLLLCCGECTGPQNFSVFKLEHGIGFSPQGRLFSGIFKQT